MHIISMKLLNWRSYKYVKFEFPPPDEQRNVILIRGANQCGKTSFFEALALGLYGLEGLVLLPRARTVPGDDAAKRITYKEFMEDALHKKSVSKTENNHCEISLEFEMGVDQRWPVWITRKWHFRDGKYLSEDEIRLYEGPDKKIVAPPAAEVNEEKWYREYITRKFLPVDLANFFLFDGEQMRHYAGLDMAEQVKKGIMGLLGLTTLHGLEGDLQDYAQKKIKTIQRPDAEKLESIGKKIQDLNADRDKKKLQAERIDQELKELQKRQNELSKQMEGYQKYSTQSIRDLINEEAEFRQIASVKTDKICELLAEEISMLLVGRELMSDTISQLDAEEKRESWEESRSQGDSKFDAYQEDFSTRLKQLDFPLDMQSQERILEVAKVAWDKIWNPPPDGIAEFLLHKSLSGKIRRQALDEMREINDEGTQSSLIEFQDKRALIRDLVTDREEALAEAETKKREQLEAELIDDKHAAVVRDEWKKVCSEISQKQEEYASIERCIDTWQGNINALKAKQAALLEHEKSDANRQAKYAEKIAGLIRDIREVAVPSQTHLIGEAMTKAWKKMSHMSERLARVDVSPDCEVRMLNSDGENLREISDSAGGDQIFTQALFWSVVHVSKYSFPFVVDTPLARLSEVNRLGVLRQFSEHNGQVFLLVTDTEEPEVRGIKEKILDCWNLRKEGYEDGFGYTSVERQEWEHDHV